jgi:hypothetical protein
MLSGAILGALIGIWQGGLFDPPVRGNRPPEMSKPAYRELATNFTLWCKFVLLEEQVSEREFNEMSIDEKLDILQGCFGHEIHSFPPPPTTAVTPRLRSG